MDKRVLIAFSGGQKVGYLLDLLAHVAAREGSAFGYYMPTPVSRSACSQAAFVCIGEQTACKEFLPQTAHVLLALEELEGRRTVRYARQDANLILCSCHRLPMAVAVGTTGYPTDILYRMQTEGRNVWQVKRTEMVDAFVAAMLLRALGYDSDTAGVILTEVGLNLAPEQLAAAYAKEYSK